MATSGQPASVGLSGGDWTRLKRLHGIYQGGSSGGSSIIQRPASFSTDTAASVIADFVTRRQAPGTLIPTLVVTPICSCTPRILTTKITNCRLCAKNGKR